METVKLWTNQDKRSLKIIKETGQFKNKREYIRGKFEDISPFFEEKYDFFTKEAAKRLEKPEDVEFPIWCGISKRATFGNTPETVIYELSVPRDQLIYFDGSKWDYVLNNIYLPKDQEDHQRFHKSIEKYGLPDEFNFIDGKYAGWYPEIEKEIRDSWPRIFDYEGMNDLTIQANLWEIREEWIDRIIHYGEDL